MAYLPNENSRSSVLLGYVEEHMGEAGDLVTYDEVLGMFDLAPMHPRDAASTLSQVVAQVNKRLHRNGDWRHLVNVMNVGYRIGEPAEVRLEVLNRSRQAIRLQVSALRATEKVIRHPDATPAERKRASDAAAAQSTLLQLVRKEQRKVANAWTKEEQSPVLTIPQPNQHINTGATPCH